MRSSTEITIGLSLSGTRSHRHLGPALQIYIGIVPRVRADDWEQFQVLVRLMMESCEESAFLLWICGDRRSGQPSPVD